VQLVLDRDGTVTERDTLDIVLQRFGDAELDAGRMTLNDVIAAEFLTVTEELR
jgi:2-hydroxy-3-keto-5-methylthiopentenyl-1-phosphate phosphatase